MDATTETPAIRSPSRQIREGCDVASDSAERPAEQENLAPNLALLQHVLKPAPPGPPIQDEEFGGDLQRVSLDPKEDWFGTINVAVRLAGVLQKVTPPYTISLSGRWGVGKTWVVQRLRRILGDAKVPVVPIDLWTQDIQDLRRSLVVEAAVGLSGAANTPREKKTRKARADRLDVALRQPEVRSVRPKVSLAGLREGWQQTVLVFGLMALSIGLIALGVVWKTLTSQWGVISDFGPVAILVGTTFLFWLLLQSGLVLSVTPSNTTLVPMKESVGLRRLFETFVTTGKEDRVLIVLDNLDRLTGQDAVVALSEIRSLVELPRSRCLFLIPLDREALVRHLVRQLGGDQKAARDYLEKFFNLDVALTQPATGDLRNACAGFLTRLFPGADSEVVGATAEIVSEAAGGSPRSAMRIANGIYARAYMLPPESRSTTSIYDVAFVESLATQFPEAVDVLVADPEDWMRRAEEARRMPRPSDGFDTWRSLLGRHTVPDNDSEWAREDWQAREKAVVKAFADLVALTSSVVTWDARVFRGILTARPDRRVVGIAGGSDLETALKAGDSKQAAAVMEGLSGADLERARSLLVDEVRTAIESAYDLSIQSRVNAVLPVLPRDSRQGTQTHRLIADYLVGTDGSVVRSFTPDAVDAFFALPLDTLPRGPAIAELLITALEPNQRPNAASLVRALARLSPELSDEQVETAKTKLLRLRDEELAPLFLERVPGYGLIEGTVAESYADRLAQWDPTADATAAVRAADRVRVALERTQWEGDASVDKVVARMNQLLGAATLNDTAIPAMEAIAHLVHGATPRAGLDEFALRLIDWKVADNLTAIELALPVPLTNPGRIAPQVATRMQALGFDDFRGLLAIHRAALEAHAVNVAEIATQRWVAGQGPQYLELAMGGDDANLPAVLAGLATVSDLELYPRLFEKLGDEVLAMHSGKGAEGVVGDVVIRLNAAPADQVAVVAPTVARIQGLASPQPIIDALFAIIREAPKGEISRVTVAARRFVEAGVVGAATLAPEVARRGATHGTVSLGDIRWLSEQAGVDPEDVRTGLREAIRSESLADVHAGLESMDGRTRRSWHIGLALVRRAATEPPGQRKGWLEDALPSGTPTQRNHPAEREDYRKALDSVLVDDSEVSDVVHQLRQRLS
jgi:KAP family P-loop domain